jgi:hypothetical protein
MRKARWCGWEFVLPHPSVVSPKFIEEQPQILRLILAQNAPKFAQDDKSIYYTNFGDRTLGAMRAFASRLRWPRG